MPMKALFNVSHLNYAFIPNNPRTNIRTTNNDNSEVKLKMETSLANANFPFDFFLKLLDPYAN